MSAVRFPAWYRLHLCLLPCISVGHMQRACVCETVAACRTMRQMAQRIQNLPDHTDLLNHDAMQEMEKYVHLQGGFFEQGLLIWWLKRTPGHMDRVYFEGDRGNAVFGINRHFPQVQSPCPCAKPPGATRFQPLLAAAAASQRSTAHSLIMDEMRCRSSGRRASGRWWCIMRAAPFAPTKGMPSSATALWGSAWTRWSNPW